MELRMMKKSLEEYTEMMRERYSRHTGKGARSALLNEFCKSTNLERKYAIKVLRQQRRRGPSGVPRGASSVYTKGDLAIIKSVWLQSGQPCGKRFAGQMICLWLKSWQKHNRAIPTATRKRIEGISASQLDRKMAAYRSGSRKRRVASSGLAAMQREVAVHCEPWKETSPGALEPNAVR
jgi:hypothetical protein